MSSGPLPPAPAPAAHDPTNTNAFASTSKQPIITSTSLIIPTVTLPDGKKQVPALFEQCEPEDLIALIASMLDRLIHHNDHIPLTPTGLTRFHSRAPPGISVKEYLVRIARYTNVEPVCLLILLHYVDKVCARQPTFTISSLTVHRFLIAAISVGSKALSDSFCTNGRYARVGGISTAEMQLLEKEFCEAIDWRLTTTGAVLAHYYTSLVRSHPVYLLPPTPATVTNSPNLTTSSNISPENLDSSDLSHSSSSVSPSSSSLEADSESGMDVDAHLSPFTEAKQNGRSPIDEVEQRGRTASPALIPPRKLVDRVAGQRSVVNSPVRGAPIPMEDQEKVHFGGGERKASGLRYGGGDGEGGMEGQVGAEGKDPD